MKNIERLNKLLGDNLGLNRYGEPNYKWVLAGELTFPVRADDKWVERNGIFTYVPQFEVRPQLPMCDRMQSVIAMWLMPPSMPQWRSMYGTEAGYPERGFYIPTDVILPLGRNPAEGITRRVMGAIKKVKSMSAADFDDHMKSAAAKATQDNDNMMHDLISDKLTAFGEVPGSRNGSTSFPSVGLTGQ